MQSYPAIAVPVGKDADTPLFNSETRRSSLSPSGSTARNRGGGVKAQKVRFGGRNWPSPISYITQISNREVTSKPDQRPSGASTVACSATMRSVKVFGNLPNRQPSCGFPPTHLCRNTTQSDNVAGSRMLRSRARIERANSHGYGRCGASQTG